MSRVFVADEIAYGRKVVLKVLPPELAAGVSADRFAREVRLAAAMQHPCIVPMLSAGTTDDCAWYTMPFVEGETLRARIGRSERLPTAEALKVLRDMASAMAYAHGRGVVHRDIKPDNVLLSGGYAVVADFGIAKALEGARTSAEQPRATLTQLGAAIGTPAYMAPEQAAGDETTDHRADIYAWGMVAYELLSGEHPFGSRKSAQALLAAQMTEVPPSLSSVRPDLPASVTQLVGRALAKDPAQRPASAAELLSVLDAVGSGEITGASKPILRRAGTSRRTTALAAGAVIVVAAVAGAALWRRAGSNAASGTPSLAVLPFAVTGGDTADVFFGDGMADELTSALAKVPGFRVASRSAAAAHRGKTPGEVGAALNVAAVLEGTVRRSGNQLRVTAQLSGVGDEGVLWSDSYTRPADNVFAVQDDIAGSIVAALRTRYAAGRSDTTVRVSGTRNVQAHESYLRARYLFNQRGGANMRSALALLQEATRHDSSYAEAHGLTSMIYASIADYTTMHPDTADARAIESATRALSLNDQLAEPHAALGSVYQGKDNPRAQREFDTAVALDPNSATAHHWRSVFLLGSGRGTEAIDGMRRAHALDPAAGHIHWTYAMILTASGQVREAKTELDRMRLVAPENPQFRGFGSVVDALSGDSVRSVAAMDTLLGEQVARGNDALALRIRAWAVQVYANAGQMARARTVLAELQSAARTDQTGWAAFSLAIAHGHLRDTAETFVQMRRTARETPRLLPFFVMAVGTRQFADDPRWAAIFREAKYDWAPIR
jgi:serine/threonine-protein kinase